MKYVIYSQFESESEGESMYWSNVDGWGDRESATIFSFEEKEIFNLPISGEWQRV